MTRAAAKRQPSPAHPPSRSGSARGLFIHKKKRLREERVSQNRSRRRGPHRAANPGHVPRLRGTRTELRRRRCVRRPDAAPGHRPAGERNPTPGVHRWTAPRRARAAPAHSGTGTGTGGGTRSRSRGSGFCPLSAVQRHFLPHSPAERARREEHISASIGPSARPPRPLSVVSRSLRLCYLLSFLLFTVNFFVPSASEGDPLGPGLVPAPTGSERVQSTSDDISEVRSLSRGREVPTHWLPQAGLPGQT